MKRLVLIVLILLLAGCEKNAISPEVRTIIAEHLHKSPKDVLPDTTFAALGADDLDVVEIEMKIEDQLGIVINDDELNKEAGVSQNESLARRLTLRAFTHVVALAPKQTNAKARSQTPIKEGILREAQVGTYSQLCSKPNPNGYVLVFVPSIKVILAIEQQRLGRKLNREEITSIKNNAAVIALPTAMAEKMKRKQAARIKEG